MPDPSLSRLLRYRFAAHVVWLILVVGATVAAFAVTDGIESDPIRMFIQWAAIAAAVLLGLRIQQRMLHRIDPDGHLRDQLQQLNDSQNSRS